MRLPDLDAIPNRRVPELRNSVRSDEVALSQPIVCAVMLTADRPEYARRAVECFRRQTYPAKRLLVFDTGVEPCGLSELHSVEIGVFDCRLAPAHERRSIGELRNMAGRCTPRADILIHWDDDDWSHPNRIAEQAALLQSSWADCVGYREMLFWREIEAGFCVTDETEPVNPRGVGEAWLYSNPNPGYALGTSLCYWRRTWERKPFPATSVGEDLQFLTGLKVRGESAVPFTPFPGTTMLEKPRMVARIHSGNTSNAYRPEAMARASEWKRVPEWDSYARGIME
jgi:hypothetical protein